MSDGGFLNTEANPEQAAPVEVAAPMVEEMPVIEQQAPAEVPEAAIPLETYEQPQQEQPQEESSIQMDEQAYEMLDQTKDAFLEAPGEQEFVFEQAGVQPATAAAPIPVATPAPFVKDAVVLEVEKILEDGLGDYYTHMPDDAKQVFHKKGEEVALEIANMVRRLRVKVKNVLLLIKQWLHTIPGVNKFFLEQEAKIKTDRVLDLEAIRREQITKP